MYPAMQNLQCLPQPRVISERYMSLNSVFGVRIVVAAGLRPNSAAPPLRDHVRDAWLGLSPLPDRSVLL